MRMLPSHAQQVLEAGCREGYITLKLAGIYPSVTALDLNMPGIVHPRVACVQGDIKALDFPDKSFDLVICTEGMEISRLRSWKRLVRNCCVLPEGIFSSAFRQDLRVHATRCIHCGSINPTTGHVNSFDLQQLMSLFGNMPFSRTEYPWERCI